MIDEKLQVLLDRYEDLRRDMTEAERFFDDLDNKLSFAWGNLAASTNHIPTMPLEEFRDYYIRRIASTSIAMADALRL